MNISYKWLKEYVDFDLTPQKTAEVLTSCGLEVDSLEEVQTIKGGLKGLYVEKCLHAKCIQTPITYTSQRLTWARASLPKSYVARLTWLLDRRLL